MTFKVFTTQEFDKRFNKLDKNIQKAIGKEIDQLQVNPFVGKPLSYSFFREKKIKNYRIYYLIYEDIITVFILIKIFKCNGIFIITSAYKKYFPRCFLIFCIK